MDQPLEALSRDELDPNSDRYHQAGLLVALLLHYPEIGSVRVVGEAAQLTLSFLLRKSPEPSVYEALRNRLTQALRVLARIEGREEGRVVETVLRPHGPLYLLDLHRDLGSTVAEEFPILLDTVNEYLGPILLVEREDGWEEYITGDGSAIADGLQRAKSIQPVREALVGFRHDGRVLVFSSS